MSACSLGPGVLDSVGCCETAGRAEVVAGELVALDLDCIGGNGEMPELCVPGGGGSGEIPTLALSLAAAAAAAEAYLSPSPAGLEGTWAGFIVGPLVLPLLMVGNGV